MSRRSRPSPENTRIKAKHCQDLSFAIPKISQSCTKSVQGQHQRSTLQKKTGVRSCSERGMNTWRSNNDLFFTQPKRRVGVGFCLGASPVNLTLPPFVKLGLTPLEFLRGQQTGQAQRGRADPLVPETWRHQTQRINVLLQRSSFVLARPCRE